MPQLKTDFEAGNLPLGEYPRPQLQRKNWQCLNGVWDYAVTKSAECPTVWQGEIVVPFCPESALSGVQRAVVPGDFLWYRRHFTVESYRPLLHTLLHFGAVDHTCQIFVNGKKAGAHFGGYTPFELDVTPYITAGENELTVCVTDATDRGDAPRGKQVLAPKGIWYTAVTGIWQTVWLEQVAENHIHALRILPSLDSVCITPVCAGSGNVILEIYEEDAVVFAGTVPLNAEEHVCFSAPRLWTPETPFLYRLVATMTLGGKMTDRVESYFGLRTFGLAKDAQGVPRLLLNGKPYFQRGVLDQGYWPDGLYTAPSDEALCSDILLAKRLGFNLLRKHMKVEPARWYYHCDRLGMLVWQDMPSGGAYPGDWLCVALPNLGVQVKDNQYSRFLRGAENARTAFCGELRDVIDALFNAVCICCWVPFNEGWGQFDALRITELVRGYDASRLIDHASGWHDQKGGDICSVHRYIFKLRAPKNEKRRAFVLSEYGGYSHTMPLHAWNAEKAFGYRMYRSKAALTAAYRRLHEQQVIPLLRRGLCASIYTQLTDVENEVNGLVTYDRKCLKIEESTIKEINARLTFSERGSV